MLRKVRELWERGRRFVNVFLTRGPALLRRIGIPFSDVPLDRRGLIVVQLDGLSHGRLRHALAQRRMPFLRQLLRKGKMRLQHFSSELPTSTPAFQGGFFYGSNDNIPGFQFYDKREHFYYRMGSSECAYRIEKEFSKPGLLRGGSVFSCVFTGEADAALFVFSTLLAPQRWRFVFRVWDIVLLTVLNVVVILKIAGLVVLEILLGLYDSLRWFVQTGTLRRELEFVALRVALTIVTRELITLGAIIDVYRRVPVIYLNYLGYDEHAHLRGPDSRVALWTLKGIDRCIERLYKAALYSERAYDFYILSDHGQCAVKPFEAVAGETLGEFLQTQLDTLLVESHLRQDDRSAHLSATLAGLQQLERWMPRLLRRPLRAYIRRTQKQLVKLTEDVDLDVLLDVFVVSSGPVAFVYWAKIPEPLTYEQIEEIHPHLVDRLLAHDGIGMVSVRLADGDVLIRSRHGQAIVGEFSVQSTGVLPCDSSPRRRQILSQIRRLTLFPRAGDLCIWGGGAPAGHVSYSFEFGAHSGWTDEETQSFIMSPVEVTEDFSRIFRHPQFYDFFRHYAIFAEPTDNQAAASAKAG
ncbi:MAG: alkaline phosphatase family protein [Candidatus Sumerlaeaceae bacterium]|jgi:hypothetical protein